MPALLRSPTAPGVRPDNKLFRHIVPQPTGRHVIREAGVWKTLSSLTTTRAESAEAVAWGGHDTTVDDTYAAELAVAGYELVLLEEDFSGPRGSMDGRVSAMGNVWHASGLYDDAENDDYLPYVRNGQMTVATPPFSADPVDPDDRITAAGYPWSYLPFAPTEIGADVIFSDAEPGLNGVGLLCSQVQASDGVTIAIQSVHPVLLPVGWGMFLLDNDSPPFSADESYTFDEPLVCDGQTKHRFVIRWDGDETLTVVSPDGTETVVSDPQVPDLWGSTVLFEPLIYGHEIDKSLPSFDYVYATYQEPS